jgi:hypothetical protein
VSGRRLGRAWQRGRSSVRAGVGGRRLVRVPGRRSGRACGPGWPLVRVRGRARRSGPAWARGRRWHRVRCRGRVRRPGGGCARWARRTRARGAGSARRRCRSADRRTRARAGVRPPSALGPAACGPAPSQVHRRARARPGGRAVQSVGAACRRCRYCAPPAPARGGGRRGQQAVPGCGADLMVFRTSHGECGRGRPRASPPTASPSRGRAPSAVTGRSHG